MTYPCWYCGGTMKATGRMTPAGERFECPECHLSAPEPTCVLHADDAPFRPKPVPFRPTPVSEAQQ